VLHRRPKTVMTERLLDAAGRRCSPATTPRCHVGRPPRDKGMRRQHPRERVCKLDKIRQHTSAWP
jgi:hypothetical protein